MKIAQALVKDEAQKQQCGKPAVVGPRITAREVLFG